MPADPRAPQLRPRTEIHSVGRRPEVDEIGRGRTGRTLAHGDRSPDPGVGLEAPTYAPRARVQREDLAEGAPDKGDVPDHRRLGPDLWCVRKGEGPREFQAWYIGGRESGTLGR